MLDNSTLVPLNQIPHTLKGEDMGAAVVELVALALMAAVEVVAVGALALIWVWT